MYNLGFMSRNGSELRVFAWANIVFKPALCVFDYSIRHIDATAKYDGLPRRFFVLQFFGFYFFLFFVFWFSLFLFLLSFFNLKKKNGKKKRQNLKNKKKKSK